MTREVTWHELECHGYGADLPVWRELAEAAEGPVLDVGAGTGRVALDLAARGHDVTALDRDGELLAELRRRAPDPPATVVADARDFDLGRRFALVIVPMQTVQLLDDRAAFLHCAYRHLEPGGILAMAIADELEPFGGDLLPAPDVGERDGWRFSSQPLSMRRVPGGVRIERLRTAWGPGGRREVEANAVELALLDASTLEAEARVAGFEPLPARPIAGTDDHVGSTVVICRA